MMDAHSEGHWYDLETLCCVWCGRRPTSGQPCVDEGPIVSLPRPDVVREGLRNNVMPAWMPREEWR